MIATRDGNFCRICRDRIYQGQEIEWRDGRPVHKDCATRPDATPQRPSPSPPNPPAHQDGAWDKRRDLE